MADEVTFSVDYDDMSGMGLWCSAHPHTNLLGDEPFHPYGSGWPLVRFNELAEAHRQAAHADGRASDPEGGARWMSWST
jgi:hypothetical protein